MTALSTESDAPVTLPWGEEETLTLALPRTWPAPEVVRPDLSGAIDDYPAALERALDAPGAGLDVGPGSTVAIVVDDPSRWTPVREALPILVRRLHALGIRREDVSISVGVGRHHAVDADAMRKRVGDAIVDAYACHSPPVDDLSAYAELGVTPEGVPVRVFRPVAEATLRITIGSVLPHLQAGFGGGYKLIFPGTSHRSTLGALHRQGLGGDQAGRLLGGEADHNPMRRAIRSAARLLGPLPLDQPPAGSPGAGLPRRRRAPGRGPGPACGRGRAGGSGRPTRRRPTWSPRGNHPWPGDPMQSFKVLLQHRAASRPGGVLVGFFWTEADQIDRSFPMPALRAIAGSGVLGGWVVRRGLALASRVVSSVGSPSAFMLRWARELVVDRTVLVFAPPLHERLGPRLGPIRLFADQDALWRAAAEALADVESPRIRVFPQGGLTYAPEPSPNARAQDSPEPVGAV